MSDLTGTLSRPNIWERVSKLATDKVVLTLIASVILLGLYDPAQMIKSLRFTLDSALYIAPFFALAIGFAGYARATGFDGLIAKAFSGNLILSVIAAALMGALSPFCSCGVIPLIAALLAAGVPLPAVMAFWIASPIMDPEMFILTAAGLGLEFAMVKTVAAVLMGMMTGYGTLLITRTGALDDVLKPIAQPSCASAKCSGPVAEPAAPFWPFWRESERRARFWREAGTAGLFLGRWLAFAFLLESLMIAYVPGEMVAAWLGNGNTLAIPLAVLVGVPAYLNGYAAIPLVRGLIDLGMSPATGLAFMLAGSVTSIPAAIAVWSLAKPRLFALYLGFAGFGALVSAMAYSGLVSVL